MRGPSETALARSESDRCVDIAKQEGAVMKITYEAVIVTPEMAQNWLSKNLNNRRLSPPRVEVYAQQMRDGLWRETGDTIKFDTEGLLVDGQHRLAAVVKSQVAVLLTVARNLDPQTKAVIDDVRPRTVADQLSIAGKTHCQMLSAVAKLAMKYMEGSLYPTRNSRKMGNATVVSFAQDHPEIESAIELGSSVGRAIGYPTAFCFSVWATRKISDCSDEFWLRVRDGVGLRQSDPELILRNSVIRRRVMDGHGRSTMITEYIIACCAKAWNAFREGEILKIIKVADVAQPIVFK